MMMPEELSTRPWFGGQDDDDDDGLVDGALGDDVDNDNQDPGAVIRIMMLMAIIIMATVFLEMMRSIKVMSFMMTAIMMTWK